MNEALPRRWSRRIRLIYVMVTAFGGIVLIVFLLLMWMLYWMKAPVKLPKPGRLIHSDATAYVVVDVGQASDARRLPAGFADALMLGAPEQARNLVLKGLNDKECRVQVVASVVPAEKDPETLLAISLGRYPGLFRVVRKDLRRRCESGSLKAAVMHHNGNEIFTNLEGTTGLDATSLIECTVLRGTNKTIAEELIDRFGSGSDASPNWPAPVVAHGYKTDEVSNVRISGWLKKWQPIPLDSVVSDQMREKLESFATGLAKAVPGITRARDFHFKGRYVVGGITLDVLFQPMGKDSPKDLTEALQQWVNDNGEGLNLYVREAAEREQQVEFRLFIGTDLEVADEESPREDG